MNAALGALVRLLDPGDTTSAGGAASALAGAMAAGLAAKVARRSRWTGTPAGPGSLPGVAAELEALAAALFGGGAEDVEALADLRRAYRMPKGGAKAKPARREAVQRALRRAAEVPLANAERCHRALELCTRIADHCPPQFASDLACAWRLARAGALGSAACAGCDAGLIQDPDLAVGLEGRARRLFDAVARAVPPAGLHSDLDSAEPRSGSSEEG